MHNAASPVANVTAGHFEQQRRQHASAGRPDRMPERDGAAVDVGDRRVDSEGANHAQTLGGEHFIELDQPDVGERESGLGKCECGNRLSPAPCP